MKLCTDNSASPEVSDDTNTQSFAKVSFLCFFFLRKSQEVIRYSMLLFDLKNNVERRCEEKTWILCVKYSLMSHIIIFSRFTSAWVRQAVVRRHINECDEYLTQFLFALSYF